MTALWLATACDLATARERVNTRYLGGPFVTAVPSSSSPPDRCVEIFSDAGARTYVRESGVSIMRSILHSIWGRFSEPFHTCFANKEWGAPEWTLWQGGDQHGRPDPSLPAPPDVPENAERLLFTVDVSRQHLAHAQFLQTIEPLIASLFPIRNTAHTAELVCVGQQIILPAEYEPCAFSHRAYVEATVHLVTRDSPDGAIARIVEQPVVVANFSPPIADGSIVYRGELLRDPVDERAEQFANSMRTLPAEIVRRLDAISDFGDLQPAQLFED